VFRGLAQAPRSSTDAPALHSLLGPAQQELATTKGGVFPVNCSRYQIGLCGVAMLVLLRITIGWHFLYAGLWKLDTPAFSAEGYLGQSRGPLARQFKELIPDYYGHQRLGRFKVPYTVERVTRYDSSATAKLRACLGRFTDHYHPSESQLKEAQRLFDIRTASIDDYLDGLEPEIRGYFQGLEQIQGEQAKASLTDSFKQRRLADREKALLGEARGWIAWVDGQENEFHKDLDALVTPEQRKLGAPVEEPSTLDRMDHFVTWTNILVGGCLIAGLFTRFAAVGGAAFLASIVVAQPDWPAAWPQPHPSAGRSLIVSKEFVEMMALLALAALPVGRWGGLDFFVHHSLVRPLFGKSCCNKA
jgi:uncharacterized membrane protein YphA (DoxX/SURF4 family)